MKLHKYLNYLKKEDLLDKNEHILLTHILIHLAEINLKIDRWKNKCHIIVHKFITKLLENSLEFTKNIISEYEKDHKPKQEELIIHKRSIRLIETAIKARSLKKPKHSGECNCKIIH